jgi:hypothetical protein
LAPLGYRSRQRSTTATDMTRRSQQLEARVCIRRPIHTEGLRPLCQQSLKTRDFHVWMVACNAKDMNASVTTEEAWASQAHMDTTSVSDTTPHALSCTELQLDCLGHQTRLVLARVQKQHTKQSCVRA